MWDKDEEANYYREVNDLLTQRTLLAVFPSSASQNLPFCSDSKKLSCTAPAITHQFFRARESIFKWTGLTAVFFIKVLAFRNVRNSKEKKKELHSLKVIKLSENKLAVFQVNS